MTDQRQVVLDDEGYCELFNDGYEEVDLRTQREQERDLREAINDHVRAYARTYGFKPTILNSEIMRKFGKARANMTVEELKRLKAYLVANYSVPQRREAGIVLVPVGRGW
jgi:hypothetical protein